MIGFPLQDVGSVLKTVYGCNRLGGALLPRRPPTTQELARWRAQCVAKMHAALKQRDTWAVGVHRMHLVEIDRDRLAGAA